MSRSVGNLAEARGVIFLQKNGFKIIQCNFYTHFGEIDIIAEKKGVLHFVEVKSGQNFEPIYNITPTKMKRLTKSIAVYLRRFQQKVSETQPYCVDALILKGDTIEFIENITLF